MSMITAPVDAVVLIALGTAMINISTLMLYVVVGKINQRLPDQQQIGYVVFHFPKMIRINREFRRLYPHSRLNAVRIAALAFGILLILVAAVRLIHFWQANPSYWPAPWPSPW
ncbi:MAG: hypothetical protein WBF06_13990 [Candidatus Acidiferrales bacterium]